jgi:PAS domain S-box-containing protein
LCSNRGHQLVSSRQNRFKTGDVFELCKPDQAFCTESSPYLRPNPLAFEYRGHSVGYLAVPQIRPGTHMTNPEGQGPQQTEQAVNDLFDSLEMTHAIETEEFRVFLDHIPIAIVISKLIRGDQRIIYANKAYEALTGQVCKDIFGRGWSILDSFSLEDDQRVSFGAALAKGDDFIGTFRREQPKLTLVEAYTGLIENEDAGKTYRIVALINVTERERTQREEFTQRLRDKDMLLKELQHRVKNNLQLITALIRLDARNQRNGNAVNLERLAGRIEALQLLYKDLSTEGLGQAADL